MITIGLGETSLTSLRMGCATSSLISLAAQEGRSNSGSNRPPYNGSPNIEVLWDWIDDIEEYFEEAQPLERIKCKLASYALEDEAESWWHQLEHHRFSWWRMKHLIAERLHTRCSTKCSPEAKKSSSSEACKQTASNRVYGATGITQMQATTAAVNCARQETKYGNIKNNGHLRETTAGERMRTDILTPIKCLKKLPNQLNKHKQEEEKEKHLMADDFSHSKCSIEVPLQSSSSKQVHCVADLNDHEGATRMKTQTLGVMDELREKIANKPPMLLADAFNKDFEVLKEVELQDNEDGAEKSLAKLKEYVCRSMDFFHAYWKAPIVPKIGRADKHLQDVGVLSVAHNEIVVGNDIEPGEDNTGLKHEIGEYDYSLNVIVQPFSRKKSTWESFRRKGQVHMFEFVEVGTVRNGTTQLWMLHFWYENYIKVVVLLFDPGGSIYLTDTWGPENHHLFCLHKCAESQKDTSIFCLYLIGVIDSAKREALLIALKRFTHKRDKENGGWKPHKKMKIKVARREDMGRLYATMNEGLPMEYAMKLANLHTRTKVTKLYVMKDLLEQSIYLDSTVGVNEKSTHLEKRPSMRYNKENAIHNLEMMLAALASTTTVQVAEQDCGNAQPIVSLVDGVGMLVFDPGGYWSINQLKDQLLCPFGFFYGIMKELVYYLMKDFLSELAKRIEHSRTTYESYQRVYVLEKHTLQCKSEEPLWKSKSKRSCVYELQMQYWSISWSVSATFGFAQDVSAMMRYGSKTIDSMTNNNVVCTIEIEIHGGHHNVLKNWNCNSLVHAINNKEGKCWPVKVMYEEGPIDATTTIYIDSIYFIEVFLHKNDTSKELLEPNLITRKMFCDPSERQKLSIAKEIFVMVKFSPTGKILFLQAFKRRGYVVTITGNSNHGAATLREIDINFATIIQGAQAAKRSLFITMLDRHFGLGWVVKLFGRCNYQMDTDLDLTRGRVIPLEGWNDENNSNTFVIAKRSVVTISLCLSILVKNGQFKRILKLFHKMVNGLDPPKDLWVSSGSFNVLVLSSPMDSLVDELFVKRDGDDVAHHNNY